MPAGCPLAFLSSSHRRCDAPRGARLSEGHREAESPVRGLGIRTLARWPGACTLSTLSTPSTPPTGGPRAGRPRTPHSSSSSAAMWFFLLGRTPAHSPLFIGSRVLFICERTPPSVTCVHACSCHSQRLLRDPLAGPPTRRCLFTWRGGHGLVPTALGPWLPHGGPPSLGQRAARPPSSPAHPDCWVEGAQGLAGWVLSGRWGGEADPGPTWRGELGPCGLLWPRESGCWPLCQCGERERAWGADQ